MCRKVCGVGPGLVFAETLHKIGCCGSRIGLVPCAIGGSCIDEWLPGTPNFERMVRHTSTHTALSQRATGGASGFATLHTAGLCVACQPTSMMYPQTGVKEAKSAEDVCLQCGSKRC